MTIIAFAEYVSTLFYANCIIGNAYAIFIDLEALLMKCLG